MDHSEKFIQLVNDAKKEIKEIDAEEFNNLSKTHHPLSIIDVRESDEWQHGHLEGASFIPRGILERDIEKLGYNFNDPIVLYCSGGYRSALACSALMQMGYKNVYSLKGGLRQWAMESRPITNT